MPMYKQPDDYVPKPVAPKEVNLEKRIDDLETKISRLNEEMSRLRVSIENINRSSNRQRDNINDIVSKLHNKR